MEIVGELTEEEIITQLVKGDYYRLCEECKKDLKVCTCTEEGK